MTYIFNSLCDLIYYMEVILQYPNQESIESILLWNFSIFLSNIFTGIRSIFSYFFIFFFKQSRDKENTITDDKNKDKNDDEDENENKDESKQRNEELIALARFETYLKSSRNGLVAVIYSHANVAECIPLSLDYACFSITALISKLEKLKDMSVKYEIESKSALVEKYEYEIKSQKEYMLDEEEPYVIDTLENCHKEARDELTTRFTELRKNQLTFLEQHKQMMLANDDFKACVIKVPISKALGFYSSTAEVVQNLSDLQDNVRRFNRNMNQLDKNLSNKLRELDRHVEDVLTLERLILKYNIAIHKYATYLKLDDPTVNKPLVAIKLENKNKDKIRCKELSDHTDEQIAQLQNDLSGLFAVEENLLKQCYDMCTRGKNDIADAKLRLTKEFGITSTSTTNKGTKDESRTILKDKGPLTQKGDVKELIINKNKPP